MTYITRLKKFLLREGYLKYYHTSPETFYNLATTVNKMTFNEIKELDKKFNIIQKYKILSETFTSTFISLAAIIYQTPLWLTYRGIKATTEKCVRKCGILNINTSKRKICLLECKMIQLQRSMNIARESQQYCDKSSDRIACLKKTDHIIRKIAQQIIDIKNELAVLYSKIN